MSSQHIQDQMDADFKLEEVLALLTKKEIEDMLPLWQFACLQRQSHCTGTGALLLQQKLVEMAARENCNNFWQGLIFLFHQLMPKAVHVSCHSFLMCQIPHSSPCVPAHFFESLHPQCDLVILLHSTCEFPA